ncbi:relaxase/mobilization nuclease domain-containing protein [Allomuricauda sp. XS_ASV26]|uniref:relaxase/mobilization nuclease domain-containing protein n=1 Tax=Allomuricauda sp. XS_ASV26 TaxID=3241292 RepID=UPI00351800CA
MIAKIIYGQTCRGTLDYILGKEGMQVLGYGNTFSQDIHPKFFGSLLHFQGQRNATKNRYAHISLNLPHDEHVDDSTFFEISKEYMEKMGYGEQPFMVVRHNDTKHEHVHILTTNVNDKGQVLSLYNSKRRSMATTGYLETKFNLEPVPRTKQEKQLPIFRLPETRTNNDDIQGTRYYIQDVLNRILQRYKVRSFEELARLVKPYHFEVRQTQSTTGRAGVAFGLDNRQGYRTRFINGSQIHRQMSGPKLQRIFDSHKRSKLLPMHRKRLLKQIGTTYDLFKTIQPHDLKEVLKEYKGMDIELDIKRDTIEGYTIYDKSGYVFREKELGKHLSMQKRLDIFGNGDAWTEINIHSKQFLIEMQKLIREAIRTSYLKSKQKKGLLSEHIETLSFTDIVPILMESEKHRFLEKYMSSEQKHLFRKNLQETFPKTQQRIHDTETIKEKEALQGKFDLIGDVLRKGVFNVGATDGSVRHLFQALGVRYQNNKLLFNDSEKYSVPVPLGNLPFPKKMEEHVSNGFVRQNHLMLEMMIKQDVDNVSKQTAISFFLPMVFPGLFKRMNSDYRQRYERLALGAYLKHAERMHASFEKSPKDYIAFFNAKGFYFEKGESGINIKSIYTNINSSYKMPKRTNLYLGSIPDLETTLKQQQPVLENLIKNRRDNLKNLWAGHLMELGHYDRVAYMVTNESVYPNLDRKATIHHMDKGLRKAIQERIASKNTFKQNRLLRKGVYAIGSLLDKPTGNQEDYNGFKDELTDYTKRRKNRGISF